MTRRSRQIIYSLLLCLVLLAGVVPVAAAAPAEIAPSQTNDIAVRPSSTTVNVGDTFTVDIMIEGTEATLGADFWLNFDPALLEVVDADGGTPGIQITPGVFDTTIFNNADNGTGLIQFGAANFGGTLAPDILVATIEFRALAYTASTPLAFDLAGTDITDGAGVSILGNALDGEVVINDTNDIIVVPPVNVVNVGEVFTVTVVVTGSVPTLGADFWLNFDETKMWVVDATNNPATEVIPGDFDTTIFNSVDNGTGLIKFGAANFAGTLVPPITVATIRFLARAPTVLGTYLTFDLAGTDITDGDGVSILGNAVGAGVEINQPTAVTLTSISASAADVPVPVSVPAGGVAATATLALAAAAYVLRRRR